VFSFGKLKTFKTFYKDESDKSVSKCMVVVKTILKICGLLACLYFFIVSLNLMSVSFPLIGGILTRAL